MHRSYEGNNAPARVYWYDDRIEIMSPGGVFGSVTAQNFGQPGVTAYRNPNLAEAMRNLRLVQRFGLGIPLAKRLLREAGHPDIEFDVDMNNVLVTIRARGKDNGVPPAAGLMTAVAGCSRGVGARHVVPLHCELRCKTCTPHAPRYASRAGERLSLAILREYNAANRLAKTLYMQCLWRLL